MSLDNLKKAIREVCGPKSIKALIQDLTFNQTANEPVAAAQDSLLEDPLVEDTLVDNILVEDAPATPMFGFDTSLKEINEAIRRAEFRSLQNDSPLKESAIRQQVVQGCVLIPPVDEE